MSRSNGVAPFAIKGQIDILSEMHKSREMSRRKVFVTCLFLIDFVFLKW